MSVGDRIGLHVCSALLILVIGCGKSTTAPAVGNGPPPPPAANPDSNLAGRIVYTKSGALQTYTPATRGKVSLGVMGVNPKYSPDGTSIVFQGGGGISVMNSDGTNVKLLSSSGGTPSFDPTGNTIAFGNRTSGVWKINVDGTGLTQLTTDGGFQPAWSPDGSQIAYNATVGTLGQQLFIMNADGGNQHRALTSKPIIDVVWRPSSSILFGLLVADSPFNYEVYSYDPSDSTSLKQLTTKGDNDFEPSWSPDGKNISWSSPTEGLWIMNADGSGQHLVVLGGRQGSWGK